jgi:REP element-mobilizing transposase RayT
LRTPKAYRVIASALFIARARFGVRIVVQSTQRNHMHLIAEARDRRALARAMQGLCIRIARGLNRLWGRKGKVFADRYHARVLATPLARLYRPGRADARPGRVCGPFFV